MAVDNTKLKIYSVDGQPIALRRPRWSGHHMYDEQKDEKERIGTILAEQHGILSPYTGALSVRFGFYMRAPRVIKKKSAWHTSRPDADNLVKFYLDICVAEGIIKDDSQVCELYLIKQYSRECRTEFTIQELEKE